VSAEDKAPSSAAGERESAVRPRTGLGLRIGNRIVPIAKAEIVLGRSSDCDVVLDGPLVSRRHAKIEVLAEQITVQDLGSRNGIQVDGRLADGAVPIKTGTKIQLGDEHIVVVELDAEMKRRITATDFRAARTMRLERPTDPEALSPRIEEAPPDPAETTLRAQSFDLLARVVDKALAMGRGAEAERVIGSLLADALKDSQSGKRTSPETAQKAAGYALKLAQATGKAAWVDYVFRLYKALAEPVPLELVDEMYTLLRKVRGVDRALMADYVALLKTKSLPPNARFVLQRIEGLDKLASL
jgi:pSer/pThr/pTyr-binding forkhead associated (FHA) protein